MSYTWAADWRGEDEPRDIHPLSCAVWNSNDPCDCDSFQAGVQEKLDRFDSYAGRSRWLPR